MSGARAGLSSAAAPAAQELAGSQPLLAVGWELGWGWGTVGRGARRAGAVGETGQVVPWGSRRERSQGLWSNGWCCESESGLEHPRVLLLPFSWLSLPGTKGLRQQGLRFS